MTPPRKLRLTRSAVNRDPMLRGVWVGGISDLPSAFPTSSEPPPCDGHQWQPSPLQPHVCYCVRCGACDFGDNDARARTAEPAVVDPVLAGRWKSLIDIADDVLAELGDGVDRALLLRLIDDLVHARLKATDVAALYRHRASQPHG